MSFIRIFFIFYRRNIKAIKPFAFTTLLISSLISSTILALILPFNSQIRDAICKEDIDIVTVIDQNGIHNVSTNEYSHIISSLSVDFNLEFSIVIHLLITQEDKEYLVPILGLSNSLLGKLNYSNNEIIGSSEFNSFHVNLTKPHVYDSIISNSSDSNYMDIYSLNITLIDDISRNSIFQIILDSINGFDAIYPYPKAMCFLVGNISLITNLIDYFKIESKELGSILLSFLDEKNVQKKSIDNIEMDIVDKEKSIFRDCVSKGINPEFIYFYSPVIETINYGKADIKEVSRTIQYLSIPNIIFILVILLNMELGTYNLFKKKRKILKDRGLSTNKIVGLFLSIELFSDILILMFSLLIFSLIVYLTHSPLMLIISLLKAHIIVFIILSLSKLANFLILTKKEIIKTSKKEEAKEKLKSKNRPLFKYNLIVTLTLLLLMQLYIMIEPLFWIQLINGIPKIVINGVTILTLVCFIMMHHSCENWNNNRTKKDLNLHRLVLRLLNNGLKKIKVQRLITTMLYSLLFYLVIFLFVSRAYTDYRQNGFLWDFLIENDNGFNYDTVLNASKEIQEIESLCPLYSNLGLVISKNKVISTEIFATNASIYASQDLGWNHFIGFAINKMNNSALKNLKGREVVINSQIANNYGLKVGDNLTLNINIDCDKILKIENVSILGIVDNLPRFWTFSNDKNLAFIDLSMLIDSSQEYCKLLKIDSFGINIFEEEDEILEQSNVAIEKAIESLLKNLNISKANVRIYTKADVNEILDLNYNVEEFFIFFELIVALFFLPLTIIIYSRITVRIITPELNQLGARGYSEKKLRKNYIKFICKPLIENMLLGLFTGLICGLIYAEYKLPDLYLVLNFNLLFRIIMCFLILSIIGIFSSFIVVLFASRQIKPISSL